MLILILMIFKIYCQLLKIGKDLIFLGTDIVSILRIRGIIKKKSNSFLDRIYTQKEQNYCNAKNNSSTHYSGKFAAKEAVKKALLSSNIIQNISLKNIEILNRNDGCPFVKIKNLSINSDSILLSISHTDEFATAVSILKTK